MQQTWSHGHFAVACRTRSVSHFWPQLLPQGSPRKIAPNEKSPPCSGVSFRALHFRSPAFPFPSASWPEGSARVHHPLAGEVLTFLLCSARCGKVIFIHIHSFIHFWLATHFYISPFGVALFVRRVWRVCLVFISVSQIHFSGSYIKNHKNPEEKSGI